MELQQAIIDRKAPVAKELTERGLKEGVKPHEFFPKAIIPAMDEVGRRMRDCEFFIPEVLIAARAARSATDILRPLLQGDQAAKPVGTVVIGIFTAVRAGLREGEIAALQWGDVQFGDAKDDCDRYVVI